MSYAVFYSVPEYNNRDAYVGSRIYQDDGLPVYQTRGMAAYKAAAISFDEVHAWVCELVDGVWVRAKAAPVPADWNDDIPF
jgi:hypothetical protein